MKKNRLYIILLFINCFVFGSNPPQKPKLIVGIVVDQMRYDYVYKYWNKFGEGGFKKMIREGSFCRNVHFNYVPTYTGPGHASIYTGTTPSEHGIVANEWYNRFTASNLYCAYDSTVNGVGSSTEEGKMSPRNMLVSTVSDEIHLAQMSKSKVIGISLKDRGAIMPAGHTANAAYWMDGAGNFISSTYYMKSLPAWVNAFNQKKEVDKYLSKNWQTVLPISEYTESIADNNPYEGKYKGEAQPVFPHKLPELKTENGNGLIKATPFGNTILKDFAISAIKGEQLGVSNLTDVLTVSFSSTDYIGHQFGTDAVELEDAYIRLDNDLSELLKYLEENLGKENVLLFLTADHGVVAVPQFFKDQRIPAGNIDGKLFYDSAYEYMVKKYGEGNWILSIVNDQVYLNTQLIAKKNMELEKVENELSEFLISLPNVKNSITAHQLKFIDNSNALFKMCNNGYHPKRSGNVFIFWNPGYLLSSSKTGTSHGSSYTYDTHVPLIFWGNGIKSNTIDTHYSITSIAPTISYLLGIEKPNACFSDPIVEVVK